MDSCAQPLVSCSLSRLPLLTSSVFPPLQAAEYAHPVEVLILGSGTIGGPLLFAIGTQTIFPQTALHIVTVYIWIIMRLFQAIEAHSGYDFPWGTRFWLPFWSGAEHHDFHHMAFVNVSPSLILTRSHADRSRFRADGLIRVLWSRLQNYSTSFRWWDHLLGTDTKYQAYRKRIEASKVSERKKIEEAENLKSEAEGVSSTISLSSPFHMSSSLTRRFVVLSFLVHSSLPRRLSSPGVARRRRTRLGWERRSPSTGPTPHLGTSTRSMPRSTRPRARRPSRVTIE